VTTPSDDAAESAPVPVRGVLPADPLLGTEQWDKELRRMNRELEKQSIDWSTPGRRGP
jgi:hypothetical protein